MITIVIPRYNEEENIRNLIEKLKVVLGDIGQDYEIIIVDVGSSGYGSALKEGLREAKGDYIITLDGDFSHDPLFIKEMWLKKDLADLVIASRYVPGGKSDVSWYRKILSIILNRTFSFILSLPIKDISNGFRMYKKEIIRGLNCEANSYNFLLEILIRAYGNGWKIEEAPSYYYGRKKSKSHVQLFQCGISYGATLFKMWQLRNSILFADYDERAFNSKIPFQRYWQRQRFRIIMNFIQDKSAILDIGCSTSKIIINLPDAVGLDIELFKLRHLSQKGKRKLIVADIKKLPFRDGVFRSIICSSVIEHVEKTIENLKEISRLLSPGSELILGTPDYGRISWLIIEWLYKRILPNAYGRGHISRYTYKELVDSLESIGFSIMDCKYILASEMIIRAKKVI